jgi:hypothetical protein
MRRPRRVQTSLVLALGAFLGCSDTGTTPPPADPPDNRPPDVTARAIIPAPCDALVIVLEGSGSDRDGRVVLYEWDFEDDGVVDWRDGTHGRVEHLYSEGDHSAKLTVHDDGGATSSETLVFTLVEPDTLHVSASTGVVGGDGSRAEPFLTIGAALAAIPSSSLCTTVLVSAERYDESPRLQYTRDLRIVGGFDPNTWQRIPDALTEVRVGEVPASVVHRNFPVIVERIAFVVGDGPPLASSNALRIVGSAVEKTFVDCVFEAGEGRDGGAGANGAQWSDPCPGFAGGSDGRPGGGGCREPWWVDNALVSGGSGGAGGTSSQAAGDGMAGRLDYTSPPLALGGAGGSPGEDGAPGEDAPPGATGAHGEPAAIGDLTDFWVPGKGKRGAQGQHGSGGGGGGGGGTGTVAAGGGGGGGGGGGFGGSGGFGGEGGGGSIAVYMWSTEARFERCRFVSRDGGDGGSGGQGGPGYPGSPGASGGAPADATAGAGGHGGHGGAPGPGGGGSGGAGGPSWGIWLAAGSPPTLVDCTFEFGTPGSGGPGGLDGGLQSRAPSGPDGTAGNLGP